MVFGLPFLEFSKLQHVELFAGQCAVTWSELKDEGRKAIAMDVEIGGEVMDLTTNAGFVAALYHTCRLSPGSGWLAAPVCSSFVFMSHGTTKRSASRPLGEESYPSVALGNLLLARTLVILMVAHALGCMWILEQPKGSVMELHPLFQEMMGKLTMWKHTISMGRYGANSDKPTWLYASHNCVEDLEDFKPKWLPEREEVEMAVIYEDSKGLKRVKGGRHLKASQAYPIG
ncbi:unnamed protein product, partial [Durusdinium trenchii]